MCPTLPSGDERGQGQFQGDARFAAKLDIIKGVVPRGPRGRETGRGPEVSRPPGNVFEQFTQGHGGALIITALGDVRPQSRKGPGFDRYWSSVLVCPVGGGGVFVFDRGDL